MNHPYALAVSYVLIAGLIVSNSYAVTGIGDPQRKRKARLALQAVLLAAFVSWFWLSLGR